MADDKAKGGKKPSGGGSGEFKGPLESSNVWEFLVVAGILALLLSAAVAHFLGFFGRGGFLSGSASWLDSLITWFKSALPYLQILSFLISALLVYSIVSTMYKLKRVKEKMDALYAPPPGWGEATAESATPTTPNPAAQKWQRIQDHINSTNPNDWKIAIIEADSILGEMVESMGYHGETLGEKLKGVERSDFTTIDSAWDAHKVRNMIAHEGSNFQLNEREAKRVIGLYQAVFEEFKYI